MGRAPTVTKADLVRAIEASTGLPRRDVRLAVNAFLQAISEELAAGRGVTLTRFGGFEVRGRLRHMHVAYDFKHKRVILALQGGPRVVFMPYRAMLRAVSSTGEDPQGDQPCESQRSLSSSPSP